MLEFRGNTLGEPLPDALDVIVDAIVAEHRQLLLDLLRSLASRLDVLLDLVLVFGRNDLRLTEDERHRREQRNGRGGRAREACRFSV